MKVKIDEEDFARAVAEDLLWSAEHAEDKRTRKALYRAAAYYMTFDQVQAVFGRKKAEEYFDEC